MVYLVRSACDTVLSVLCTSQVMLQFSTPCVEDHYSGPMIQGSDPLSVTHMLPINGMYGTPLHGSPIYNLDCSK